MPNGTYDGPKDAPRRRRRVPSNAAWRRILALELYCNLGDARSLPLVRQVWSDRGLPGPVPSDGWLRKWSAKEGWVAKAREFDERVAREVTEQAVDDAVAMANSHRAVGRGMRNLGQAGLATYLDEPEKLPGHVLVALMKEGVAIERDGFGLSEERQAITAEIAARCWGVVLQETDTPDLEPALRAALRERMREGIVRAVTADGVGSVPEWMLEVAEDDELTPAERAAASVAVEAVRRGLSPPDMSDDDRLIEGPEYPAASRNGG